jgi:transcription initiation factor TFIID subunit 10
MSEEIKETNPDSVMDVDIEDEDDIFNDGAEGTGEVDTKIQDDVNNDEEEDGDDSNAGVPGVVAPELPEFTRKDKTMHEILEMMEDYSPIVSNKVFSCG